MQILKRILMILTSLIGALLVVLVLLLTVSPKPAIKIFAPVFNGTVPIKNYKEYQSNRQASLPIKRLVYGKQKDENMDLYQPKGQISDKVVVWVHGGGFIGGDKAGLKEFATALVAKNRVSVLALNYTVAPDGKYPTQVKQLAQALAFLKAHAGSYNLRPNNMKVILGGDSAGAQIAGQYAALATNKNYQAQMPAIKIVSKLDLVATILYCGPYDFNLITQDAKKQGLLMQWFVHTVGWAMTGKFFWSQSKIVTEASIPKWVNSNFPATYITDGNHYSFESSGKLLVDKLKAHNVPVTTRFFAKNTTVNHEYQFELDTPRAQTTLAQTIAFINNH